MRPELFRIGDVSFSAYRTCLTVAFIACTILIVRRWDREGETAEMSPTAGIWAFLGALWGAKVFYVLQYDPTPLRHLWRSLLLWEGGLVYYGGLFGGMAVLAVYLRVRRIPIVPAFDVMAVYLPLGQAITRVGCFLNGCCYGTPCTLPWAVSFPPSSDAFLDHARAGLLPPGSTRSLPVHPTQLYMVAGLLIIVFILDRVRRRKPPAGSVALAYLACYGTLRFLIEFVRGDNAAFAAGLTLYQVISLPMLIAAFALLLWRRSNHEAPRCHTE